MISPNAGKGQKHRETMTLLPPFSVNQNRKCPKGLSSFKQRRIMNGAEVALVLPKVGNVIFVRKQIRKKGEGVHKKTRETFPIAVHFVC